MQGTLIVACDEHLAWLVAVHPDECESSIEFIQSRGAVLCNFVQGPLTIHRERHIRIVVPSVQGAVMHSHNEAAVLSESLDRKSTRLNSSHVAISYAVFCLK